MRGVLFRFIIITTHVLSYSDLCYEAKNICAIAFNVGLCPWHHPACMPGSRHHAVSSCHCAVTSCHSPTKICPH
ncbi:uncharacterized protein EI90DRAFT_3079030 [Cantharellus anzutake]|uniref:uncharacterized protein n=1 Tax=Cantharellus anzutake TaxID=1750568 RepID=UPI001903ADAC|nr:uncharacterized protein EI90DRAFT_3079030 [Cantharellus anzutake]KAF8321869.1 hypothetical protein EI90DRAFT_3079030 [Cantharellus anzutake]